MTPPNPHPKKKSDVKLGKKVQMAAHNAINYTNQSVEREGVRKLTLGIGVPQGFCRSPLHYAC